MATASTHIRIDPVVKEQANELFSDLGMDLSSAVNIFLRQCILHKGIPFKIEKPEFSQETLEAIDEAKRLLKDPNTPRYHTMEEYWAALKEDDE